MHCIAPLSGVSHHRRHMCWSPEKETYTGVQFTHFYGYQRAWGAAPPDISRERSRSPFSFPSLLFLIHPFSFLFFDVARNLPRWGEEVKEVASLTKALRAPHTHDFEKKMVILTSAPGWIENAPAKFTVEEGCYTWPVRLFLFPSASLRLFFSLSHSLFFSETREQTNYACVAASAARIILGFSSA